MVQTNGAAPRQQRLKCSLLILIHRRCDNSGVGWHRRQPDGIQWNASERRCQRSQSHDVRRARAAARIRGKRRRGVNIFAGAKTSWRGRYFCKSGTRQETSVWRAPAAANRRAGFAASLRLGSCNCTHGARSSCGSKLFIGLQPLALMLAIRCRHLRNSARSRGDQRIDPSGPRISHCGRYKLGHFRQPLRAFNVVHAHCPVEPTSHGSGLSDRPMRTRLSLIALAIRNRRNATADLATRWIFAALPRSRYAQRRPCRAIIPDQAGELAEAAAKSAIFHPSARATCYGYSGTGCVAGCASSMHHDNTTSPTLMMPGEVFA